jgi:ABC-type Zn uptake system ZnuABC Zn-binding protein ZnuA
MVKLRQADLLVRNGLEGDPWVEPLVRGAGNGRLTPGGPGLVDVSLGIQILGIPQGPVDRGRADVHPEGNPHFTPDPANATVVTANLLEGLARLAPSTGPRSRHAVESGSAASTWPSGGGKSLSCPTVAPGS